MAAAHAERRSAAGLRGLRLGLESLDLARHAGLAVTVALSIVAAWVMAGATLSRHADYQSNAYDLGFFDQIIWNTSQGRLFETSFVSYNFLGQHFDPILLALAGTYRAGAGIESLLVTASFMAALAAIPLYIAAGRLSGSSIAGVLCAGAFLLSAPLHEAVNFDFHPETMMFVFVFTAAAFLAYSRPWPAVASLLPLLLIKEDMALVLIALAVLIALRGHRRQAAALGAVAGAWFVVTVLIVMPLVRGGGSDLTRRYSYLIEDTTPVTVAPYAAERAATHLAESAVPGTGRLLLSTGGLALLSPAALLAAAPLGLLSGLSDHPQQAGLRLHYAMPVLALMWFGAVFSLETLRRWRDHAPLVASAALVVCSAVVFAASSPFAPGRGHDTLPQADAITLRRALDLIPGQASVQAQSSLLPHLSRRRHVFEFPDDRRAEYVVLASGLPKSSQSLAKSYGAKRAALPSAGYTLVFQERGVEVWRSAR